MLLILGLVVRVINTAGVHDKSQIAQLRAIWPRFGWRDHEIRLFRRSILYVRTDLGIILFFVPYADFWSHLRLQHVYRKEMKWLPVDLHKRECRRYRHDKNRECDKDHKAKD